MPTKEGRGKVLSTLTPSSPFDAVEHVRAGNTQMAKVQFVNYRRCDRRSTEDAASRTSLKLGHCGFYDTSSGSYYGSATTLYLRH